jgi:branched-chain amino acid transport system ATP-binding protein
MTASNKALLTVSNLNVRYGNIHATQGLNLQVNEGELVCLIGANGAGKSSTLNALAGISKLATHQRVAQGIALVPEGRGVFPKMTVLENLQMGAYLHQLQQSELDAVFARFPRLAERRDQLAGTLSGGEQQMLAIGRALLSRPKLLLLDEPSMGLAPLMIELIFNTLAELKKSGLSILLVEQNARGALQLADRAYVLEHGEMTLSGTGQELLHDARVQAAYLGAGIES